MCQEGIALYTFILSNHVFVASMYFCVFVFRVLRITTASSACVVVSIFVIIKSDAVLFDAVAYAF